MLNAPIPLFSIVDGMSRQCVFRDVVVEPGTKGAIVLLTVSVLLSSTGAQ